MVLGFGAMRLPMQGEGPDARIDRSLAIPMIHKAFEAGVNYIDTAVGYCNQDSQRAVGDALKGWRYTFTLPVVGDVVLGPYRLVNLMLGVLYGLAWFGLRQVKRHQLAHGGPDHYVAPL